MKLIHTILAPVFAGILMTGQTAGAEMKSAGEASIVEDKTEWCFVPSSPWQAGVHVVVVPTHLEDVSGNNLRAAFDVPSTPPAPALTSKRRRSGSD